jgi:type I restriction enzyme S subunit
MIEPKLRFKTDDGSDFPEWNEIKISDAITESKRPIHMKDDDQYQLLTVKRRNEGIVSRGLFCGKNILVKNYYQVKQGDYIISKRQIVHGANGIVSAELDGAIVSNEYMVLSNSDVLLMDYLALYSMTKKMYHKFYISSYGVDIEKMFFNIDDWKKKTIYVPCLEEQKKIVMFLHTIDMVIDKQKAIVALWEKRKKGVMQKLFSQEIRFKANDGSQFPEWEEKKISECTKFVKDGTHGTHKNVSNGHPLLSAKDIFDNVVHIPNDSRLISDEDYNKIFSKYNLQVGDVLITIVGTLGRTALVTDVCKHVAFQRSVGIMRPDKNIIDSSYLKTVCDVAYFQNQLEIKKNKGAQAGVYLGTLSDIAIPVPCLVEQKKIADCLSALDDVIDNYKETLNAWKELKKGLLQQMFV